MGHGSRSLRSLVRDDVDVASDSIFKEPKTFQIRLPDPAARAPGLCMKFSPERAWGMPGAQCTRSLACKSETSTRASSPQVQPDSPGIPTRTGFNGLFRSLPGDEFVLSPSSAD